MTPVRTPLRLFAGITLTIAFSLASAAQTAAAPKPPSEATPPQASATSPAPTGQAHPYTGPMWPTSVHFFHLSSTTTQQMQNEILVSLRNLLDPRVKVALSPSSNTILIGGTDDQIALAQKIITDLDKPSKAYRLTYTLIDFDGTKRVGDQHYSMVLVPGQRTVLKQGNKVPVYTGAYVDKTSTTNQQVTYLDVGMDFDATLDDSPNSLGLKTKVSQSSVVEDRTTVATTMQDPVLRQSVFEGSAILTPGKPLVIGNLDIAGTTRRIEIQVIAEPLAQ
jgi:type II secretory pathway component GspD/PulD (secretin)